MLRDAYSESEAADVLSRAARLQSAADTARAPGALTLADLKEAAAAAGIAPEFVEHAAYTLTADAPAPPPIAGAPVGVRRTRLVEGRVDEAAWGRIVADLRRTLGGKGTVEQIGDVRTWSRAPLRVTVESAGEFTRITATGAWAGEVRAALVFTFATLFVVLAMGVTAAFSGSALVPLTFVFAALAALGAAQTWPKYRAKATRVGRKFDAALDRIEASMRGASEAPGRSPETEAPLLALPDDAAPEHETALVRPRTRG